MRLESVSALVRTRRIRWFGGAALAVIIVVTSAVSCQGPTTPSTAPATATVSQNTATAPSSDTTTPTVELSPTTTPTETAPISPTTTNGSASATPVATQSTPTVASAPSLTIDNNANAGIWKTGVEYFPFGQSDGLRQTNNGLELTGQQGKFTSAEQTTPIAFNNAILSWSATMPAGTSLKAEMRVHTGQSWSTWYTMGTWTNGQGASAKGQSDSFGSVDVDTLTLKQPADGVQYRITMSSSTVGTTPTLRSVTVSYADMRKPLGGDPVTPQADWAKDLNVPQISQAVQDPAIRWEICSPTSLTMVLNYWGANKGLMDVVNGVQDQTTGIYGNWPMNTSYAATLGFDAHIARFHSIESLQNEIAQGRPVLVSIKFGAGELDNAPISSTTGHLIVVRGFTANGDVIVNDPAAPSADSVRRVYKRAQFTNVWLSSGGIAYVLIPPSQQG